MMPIECQTCAKTHNIDPFVENVMDFYLSIMSGNTEIKVTLNFLYKSGTLSIRWIIRAKTISQRLNGVQMYVIF